MSKKVGIITFHASFNYGSMLQTYALQQTVLGMGYDCEVINFRTKRQKDMFKPLFCQGSLVERMKRLLVQYPYIKDVLKKNRLYEDFLNRYITLTPDEYSTLDELMEHTPQFDYYISGSDQIWNTQCFDYDLAYMLPFVKTGKRIAYAPSMGPQPEDNAIGGYDAAKGLLQKYDAISVREPRTAEYVEALCGKTAQVVLDPTLLLPSERWDALVDSKPMVNGDYLFLYSPKFTSFDCTYDLADKISKRYKMQVILSRGHIYMSQKRMWPDFKIRADVGPREFLNLCKHARLICCDSFHAVVFAILFRKPFVVMNGMDDSRISNLLKLTGLENHSLCMDSSFGDEIFEPSCIKNMDLLRSEIKQSMAFLENSLR